MSYSEADYVVRGWRSDDPSLFRRDHWWIETPDGYVIRGPFDTRLAAERALEKMQRRAMA